MDLVGGDEEFLDLLDKEHLLPRMNEQLELGEHIIEASVHYLLVHTARFIIGVFSMLFI